MSRSFIHTAMGLLCAGFSATAVMGKGIPNSVFEKLDKNADKRISMEEFKPTGPPALHPRMKQVFDSFDKEQTGTLSYEDAAKVIQTVSSVMPNTTPELAGEFKPVALEVNDKTKRAFVKLTINGQTGTFLFDTGTSDTIIDPDFAKRAGVDFVEVCQTITAGNMGKIGDAVSLVRIPELIMGEGRFKNFHAVMKTSRSKTYETGSEIDGVLGGNIIFAKPVTLDYAHGKMTYGMMDSAKADMSFDLLKEAKVPAVEADIDGVKVRLMFDSGAAIGDSVLINERYHAAFRELAGKPDATGYTARSVRVGGTEIHSKIYCHLKPFEWSVVSSQFYGKHVMSIDMQAGKLLIKKNPAAADSNSKDS